VRYSLENPFKTNLVNTVGTLNVLEATRRNSPRKLIVASTSSVYGAQKVTPAKEDAPTNPLSIYGTSKLAAEGYCLTYMREYGLPVTVLRLHSVYGPRQRPDMAIAKWVSILEKGNRPVAYGDGRQKRDFTYVQDIIEGIWSAVGSEAATGEIVNLGSGRPVDLIGVLKLIGDVMHREVNPIFEKPRLDEPQETHADITKAQRLLNYQPKVSIHHGISLYYHWYSKGK
jgi:UDP-glucose 4-epimerase